MIQRRTRLSTIFQLQACWARSYPAQPPWRTTINSFRKWKQLSMRPKKLRLYWIRHWGSHHLLSRSSGARVVFHAWEGHQHWVVSRKISPLVDSRRRWAIKSETTRPTSSVWWQLGHAWEAPVSQATPPRLATCMLRPSRRQWVEQAVYIRAC